ncbi:RnfABCDGE type electron transport complex subunit D, partial [Kosmotoga pacifica]
FFEYVFERKKKKKPISEAAIVTGMLFALILPSTIPFWIVIFGSAFGIIFAKEAFGGFGRNVFNPAMVGRTFLCQLSYCNDHGLDKTCKLLGTRIFEEFSN